MSLAQSQMPCASVQSRMKGTKKFWTSVSRWNVMPASFLTQQSSAVLLVCYTCLCSWQARLCAGMHSTRFIAIHAL